jgi:hypothetical protein
MNKKAPKRGSAEERWYYLTEEGRNSIDLGDEFDHHRAFELLFEDAPEVNWEHCSMKDFQALRDAGVITKASSKLLQRISFAFWFITPLTRAGTFVSLSSLSV